VTNDDKDIFNFTIWSRRWFDSFWRRDPGGETRAVTPDSRTVVNTIFRMSEKNRRLKEGFLLKARAFHCAV